MTIAAPGAGSNLDVAGLVEQLMSVERVPLQKLDKREAAVQVKVSAYATLRGALSAFRTTLSGLREASRFVPMRAALSDASVATVTASTSAAASTYSLEVLALASAHRLTSGAFTQLTDTVGTGTITIQYGAYDSGANTFTPNATKSSQSITIDGAQGSLTGVRDAINAANVGVTASIINDGTGQRLVFSSKDTGASNGLRITVSDLDGDNTDTAGLSRLAYDPIAVGAGKNLTQLVAAQDASLRVDGLAVTRSSNAISDMIDGVTLQLSKANVGAPTTLTVSQDGGAARAAVESFVKAYNELGKTLGDLGKYDPKTRQAGALQSDSALRGVAQDLRNRMVAPGTGLVGSYTQLAAIGITFERDGNLKLDAAKLDTALRADPSAAQKLFAGGATVTDPLIRYVGSTSRTKPGSYAVDVGSVARAGSLVGSAAVAGLTVTAANDGLDLTVDGVAVSVALTQQTYASHAALASELQTRLNTSSALLSAGASVTVTESAGVLTVTSNRLGASSSVTVAGGDGQGDLFGGTPTATAGTDVTGSLGGAAAVVSGDEMTGATGTSAEGLRVQVRGGALGARGQVHFARGLAAQLDDWLGSVLDTKGTVSTRLESLDKSIKDIAAERLRVEDRLEKTQSRYERQFGALDQTLTSIQRTSSYLAQQLANINNNNST